MRLRRIAAVAAAIALVPVFFSYLHAVTQTSNSPLGIRTVEWLRDNGAAGIVAKVESTYYSLTAPSKGGPTLKALPRVGYGTAPTLRAAASEYRPARVPALLYPALPGEGVWHATRPEPRRRAARARDHAARPARIPARAGGGRLDQHAAHDYHAQPGPARARREPPARRDGGAAREPSTAARDFQQRLQAGRLARRLRGRRPHLRADCSAARRRSSVTPTEA